MIVVTLIAGLISSVINDQHSAIWHQGKLLSLDYMREKIQTIQASELDAIIRQLSSYADLNSIPNNFIVKHDKIALKYTMVVPELKSESNDYSGVKCKIFKAEIDSSFDFNSSSRYHKKITSTYLYVLACQNLNYDASNDHQINAFPFSKFNIGP